MQTQTVDDPTDTAAATPQLSDDDLADFDSVTPAPEPATTDEPDAAAAAAGDEGGEGGGDAGGEDDTESFDPELLKAVAGEGDATAPMIPKSRFDEATAKLKDELRAKNEEVEALRTKIPTTPPRDFAAETAALEARYESGEIEDEQYRADMRALARDQGREEGRRATEQAFFEQQQKAQDASWQQTINAWASEHADFLANGWRRGIVKTLLDEYGKDPNLSDAELLAKVQAEAFEAANWTPSGAAAAAEPAAAPAPKPADLHAARNARDAKAQAAASAAPTGAVAGAGNRGNRPGLPANLVGVKGKDYESLPADLRNDKDLADF